jgi:hypothetical protein
MTDLWSSLTARLADTDPLVLWLAVGHALALLALAAGVIAYEVRTVRREQAYRRALNRGDWPEVHRLMGLGRHAAVTTRTPAEH